MCAAKKRRLLIDGADLPRRSQLQLSRRDVLTGIVRSNARDGVLVLGGSVEVDGAVSNNARHGISIFNSGTAIVDDGAVVASNSANGVLVEDGTVTEI